MAGRWGKQPRRRAWRHESARQRRRGGRGHLVRRRSPGWRLRGGRGARSGPGHLCEGKPRRHELRCGGLACRRASHCSRTTPCRHGLPRAGAGCRRALSRIAKRSSSTDANQGGAYGEDSDEFGGHGRLLGVQVSRVRPVVDTVALAVKRGIAICVTGRQHSALGLVRRRRRGGRGQRVGRRGPR